MLFSTSGFASTPLPLEQLNLQAQVVTNLQNNTVPLLEDGKLLCASSILTADGYLLTALHCLRDCLIENNQMEQAKNKDVGVMDIAVVRKNNPLNIFCSHITAPQISDEPIQVVATGNHLTILSPTILDHYPVYYNELKQKDWITRSSDFAILKVRPKTSLRCLKLSTGAVSAKDIVAVGFPVSAATVEHPIQLRGSAGEIYGTVEESVNYREQSTASAQLLKKILYQDPRTLFSSASVNPGQSGGPIVNLQGEIVGVVSGYENSKGGVHELSGSFVGPMRLVLNQAAGFGDRLWMANQACAK